MAEVAAVSMVGGTISPNSDSARDVQSLGPPPSLAHARCLLHRKEKLCLDNAFALIEGHPPHRRCTCPCCLHQSPTFAPQKWATQKLRLPHPPIRPVRTSARSPWQNGVAERWVESCRRDLLDHVIALNEEHLKRLLSDYVRYYHEDRTHLGLGKETPSGRSRSTGHGRVIIRSRLGGLPHRYDRAA